MPAYDVHLTQTVSTVVTVEAEDPDAAIELAYESHDMPTAIKAQAFGDARVDESGEWEPVEVIDRESGESVWAER